MESRQPVVGTAPNMLVPVKAHGLGALIALSTFVWIGIALFADLVY